MDNIREKAANLAGVEVRNPADTKMYPVQGQGVEKRSTPAVFQLPVVEVQHLTTAPTLKSWLDSQEGEPLTEEHASIIQSLKTARKNGAPINLNVNSEGKYDLAFSGSNGNMARIEDFRLLMQSGLSFGDCLRITKLVCGPNGTCGNPGPCNICRDIRDGCFEDGEFIPPPEKKTLVPPLADELDEDISSLVSKGGYELQSERIVNKTTRRSASVVEVKKMCREMSRGVVYVLEMLGVYRLEEGKSNTSLKRIDLGGH